MPRVLGFQKWNAERVRFGMKRQTVRAPARTLPAGGDQRMFYSGLRTRYCRPVFPEAVTMAETCSVTLLFRPPYHMTDVLLSGEHALDPVQFAFADGFGYFAMRAKGAWMPDRKAYWVGMHIEDSCADVMGCWFRHTHPAAFEAGRFEGVLLRWAPPVRVTSEAEYREAFGAPIDPVDFKHMANAHGWRGESEGLPPDMPEDLRRALGD